jgi:hypothetical protein
LFTTLLVLLMQPPPVPSTVPSAMPKVYVCPRVTTAPTLDGRIDDGAWQACRWTDDFVDIEGPRRPAPRFRTRAKMAWDDAHLYVAAELEEPHVVGALTERNSVIYNENDFEIFIDPDGDNHDYYEFEVNALGTIWELALPKPYKDGGKPNVAANIAGVRSAVQVRGTINDPSDTDRGWTLEVAIPWEGLARYNKGRPTPPRSGGTWRVNFSRVQWTYDVAGDKYVKRPKEEQPEDNWVWSPQGVIDMHRPERWGVVMFAPRADARVPDEVMTEIGVRDGLMEVYYRQRAFKRANGRWAKSLDELGLVGTHIELSFEGGDWTAALEHGGRVFSVRADSRLWSK